MPTAVGPNTKGEENLVFGYDLGDVSNSYRGEPTVNIIDGGANRATAVTGVWQHGNHAGANSSQITNIDLSATYPNRSSVIKVKTTNATGYGMINQRMSTNATSGSTYTYSFDYKQIAYDGTWTPTAGAYGDGYKVPNSSYTNVNTAYQYIPLSDGWTRFVMTYDATYTGRNVFRSNMNTNDTADFEILLDNFQIQAGNRVTPFTAGTRSATQGLIDLTGNSTIDLTNVSFDSNAQMTFDGTSDYVDLGSPSVLDLSTVTQEVVYQPLGINRRNPIIGDNNPTGSDSAHAMWLEHYDNNTLILVFGDGSTYGDVFSTATITDTTKYHHIVCVRDASAKTVEYFINGVSDGVKDWANKSTIGTPIVYDGSFNNNNYNHYIGASLFSKSYSNIPYVKMYNRALTASEIKANYNAIKGRFNI